VRLPIFRAESSFRRMKFSMVRIETPKADADSDFEIKSRVFFSFSGVSMRASVAESARGGWIREGRKILWVSCNPWGPET